MTDAVERIADGRIDLRTEGQAENGRINFHDGIRLASEIFTEVQVSRDSYLMLLAEYVYTAQDLAGSRPDETHMVTDTKFATTVFEGRGIELNRRFHSFILPHFPAPVKRKKDPPFRLRSGCYPV
jgi:hypothetical protein